MIRTVSLNCGEKHDPGGENGKELSGQNESVVTLRLNLVKPWIRGCK